MKAPRLLENHAEPPGTALGVARRLSIALALLLAVPGRAEPFRPASDDVVLVRLPRSAPSFVLTPGAPPLSPSSSSPSVTTQVDDIETVIRKVRHLIQEARREADPRLLSRARVLLKRWWSSKEAPTEITLLKAEIRQGLHDFSGALAEVDEALRKVPRHPGAWLLKAHLSQIVGDYATSRQACLQLARFGDELTAVTAAAALGSLTTPNASSALALEAALQRHADSTPELRAWAATTLGEIRMRQGDLPRAEASLRLALTLEPGHPYTLSVLADVLLAAKRPAEVVALLHDATPEALRLRLAEGLVAMKPSSPQTRELLDDLGEAFELSAQRGDDLHLRERARFVARIRANPQEALALAQRNWQVQKEPADLQLLVETARLAGDKDVVAQMTEWARQNQPGTPL